MAKVPYAVTCTAFLPTRHQAALMSELADSTYYTYCRALDGLIAGRWDITEDNFTDIYNNDMRRDWYDHRPQELCPIVMMKYVHREACHNWLDNGKDPSLSLKLKAAHKNLFYMPASGHSIRSNNTLAIAGVGLVHIEPVTLPGRMYVIIGHRQKDKWVAEIRSALG